MTRLILSASLLLSILLPSSAMALVTVTFPYDGFYDGIETETPGAIQSGNVSLDFTVDAFGMVSMDAVTTSTDQAEIDLVDQWDLPGGAAGTITAATMFDSSFTLELEPQDGRLGTGGDMPKIAVRPTDTAGVGRIGLTGLSAGLLDDDGTEAIFIGLLTDLPDARLEFDELSYSQAVTGSQFEFDSYRETLLPENPDHIVVDLAAIPDGVVDMSTAVYQLKDSSDRIVVASVNGSPGAAITGFTFDLIVDVFGDIDSNGVLDAGDITAFSAGWNTDTTGFTYDEQIAAGDINHDDIVNFLDWSLLREAFAATGSGAAAGSFVPEPSAMILVCLLGSALGLRTRRM